MNIRIMERVKKLLKNDQPELISFYLYRIPGIFIFIVLRLFRILESHATR